MTTNPEVIHTARLLVQDDDGYIYGFIRPLSSKQRAGDVDFGGGKVNSGEDPQTAAIREFKEETGFDITGDAHFHYGVSERDGDKWFTRHYYLSEERIEPRDIKHLSEHIGMVCASRATVIDLTDCVPHQAAISCLELATVA